MTDRRAVHVVVALALAAAACGHPEQKVVDQYFGAVNARDNDTLSSFAVVNFDTKDKRIDNWKINGAGDEQVVDAPLLGLVQALKDADAKVNDNKKEYLKYFFEHPTEVDQVKPLVNKPGATIPPKLQPYAARWKEFTDKERELKKAVAEAKDAVEKEKRLVALSIGTNEGLEAMTGKMRSKTLDVAISIGGETKDYTMVLRKFEMTGGTQRTLNRWVIYELKPKG
jgi:hypothetical protein